MRRFVGLGLALVMLGAQAQPQPGEVWFCVEQNAGGLSHRDGYRNATLFELTRYTVRFSERWDVAMVTEAGNHPRLYACQPPPRFDNVFMCTQGTNAFVFNRATRRFTASWNLGNVYGGAGGDSLKVSLGSCTPF